MAGTEGDFNVPILAPRASDAAVPQDVLPSTTTGRLSRRDEPVTSRPQAYELINPTLESSLLQNTATTSGGVGAAGVVSRRTGITNPVAFSRNHSSSLGYRSLR